MHNVLRQTLQDHKATLAATHTRAAAIPVHSKQNGQRSALNSCARLLGCLAQCSDRQLDTPSQFLGLVQGSASQPAASQDRDS